jgi:hypothetical protein
MMHLVLHYYLSTAQQAYMLITENVVAWHYDLKGFFSVRSAYKLQEGV